MPANSLERVNALAHDLDECIRSWYASLLSRAEQDDAAPPNIDYEYRCEELIDLLSRTLDTPTQRAAYADRFQKGGVSIQELEISIRNVQQIIRIYIQEHDVLQRQVRKIGSAELKRRMERARGLVLAEATAILAKTGEIGLRDRLRVVNLLGWLGHTNEMEGYLERTLSFVETGPLSEEVEAEFMLFLEQSPLVVLIHLDKTSGKRSQVLREFLANLLNTVQNNKPTYRKLMR